MAEQNPLLRGNGPNIGAIHKMELTEIYVEFGASKMGLTSEDSRRNREKYGSNNVPPPLSAPAWLCCLLPCLLKTKAMEDYNECVPEFATVLRNKKWLKMDSGSLVLGDIIRLQLLYSAYIHKKVQFSQIINTNINISFRRKRVPSVQIRLQTARLRHHMSIRVRTP
jgi:Cation transporter/ATPase, N-terminus